MGRHRPSRLEASDTTEPWPPRAQQPKLPDPRPPRASRRPERRPAFWWVLALLILTGILLLSLGPEFIPDLPDPWNRVQHAVGYATLTWVLLRGLGGRSAVLSGARIALGALFVIALGAGLELAQAGVNRDAEVADFLANIAGVVGALFGWLVMRSLRQDRRP